MISRRGVVAVVVGGLCALALVACAAITPTVQPDCEVHPLPTGEKYIPLEIGTPPPPFAYAGQGIEITLSGGYLVANHAVVCDGQVVDHVHSDALPGWTYTRTVGLEVDGQRFGEHRCGSECTIAASIPPSTEVGVYPLYVLVPAPVRSREFELFIVPSPTP